MAESLKAPERALLLTPYRRRDTAMSQTTSAEKAEEVLWTNYEPPERQMDIWEEERHETDAV